MSARRQRVLLGYDQLQFFLHAVKIRNVKRVFEEKRAGSLLGNAFYSKKALMHMVHLK